MTPATPGTETQSDTKSRDLITLAAAAKVAPGRPSANAIWRWCRKGVLSRGGTYVRLRHVRLGGRVFTSMAWLAEFGEQLAAADSEHFERRATHSASPGSGRAGAGGRCRAVPLAEIEQELESEGL